MKYLILILLPLLIFAEQTTTSPSSIDFTKELTKILLTLGVLLILFFASLFLIKRLMNQKTFKMNSESDIQIIQKRPLSGKTVLYVIDCYGKKIVVSESSLEVKTLYQKNDPIPTKDFLAIIDQGKKKPSS